VSKGGHATLLRGREMAKQKKLSSHPVTPGPRTVPDGLAEVTGFLVNELARVLREKTSAAVGELGLRPRQLGLLLLLQSAGPMPQQELGEMLGMDRTTVMQFVLELEAAGIVARRDHPEDGRAYQVYLTAHGRRLASTASKRVQRVDREVLKILSASERKTFKSLLGRLLTAQRDSVTGLS
jgi:DNA-binding MarR family transcriptional regulator